MAILSKKKKFFVSFYTHKSIFREKTRRNGKYFVLNKQKWSKDLINNAGNFAGTIPES